MFAPKVAKPGTKAAENPASKVAAQHSQLVARLLDGGWAEQMLFPQRAMGNQATAQLLAQRTLQPAAIGHEQEVAQDNMMARETSRGVSWDFSKIPIFTPDETNSIPPQGVRACSDTSAVNFLHRNQAVAATIDRDTVLIDPAYRHSRAVVSHELAHITQLRSGRSASRAAAEAEAARAAAGAHIAPSQSVGAATPPMFLSIAERLGAARSKAEVFDLLRGLPAGDANTAEVGAAIRVKFGNAPDDLWLATQLQIHGPEPLWDPVLLAERARRATTNHWLPEAGNIAANLTTPGQANSVRAYFFPGRDPEKRALIFAGVHESEPEGIAVAEDLRSRLATDSAAGRPPAYTTIVVPNLFEDRNLSGPLKDRRTIGVLDPNRNFPGDVTPGVRGGSDSASDEKGRPIFAENRILMALVERFQPQRVASIHAHSLKNAQGDSPGIFVDPRADSIAKAQDISLAQDMARAVAAGLPAAEVASADPHVNPLIGDYAQLTASELKKGGSQTTRAVNDPNVLYDPSAPKVSQGVSAGGWFPQSSALKNQPSAQRAPVAIYTIEVPEWRNTKDAKALPPIEQLEAKVLQEIFLGAPARP